MLLLLSLMLLLMMMMHLMDSLGALIWMKRWLVVCGWLSLRPGVVHLWDSPSIVNFVDHKPI